MPITSAATVVAMKRPSVRPPILPSRRKSPNEATPTVSEKKTSGTTTMRMSAKNRLPNHAVASTNPWPKLE